MLKVSASGPKCVYKVTNYAGFVFLFLQNFIARGVANIFPRAEFTSLDPNLMTHDAAFVSIHTLTFAVYFSQMQKCQFIL